MIRRMFSGEKNSWLGTVRAIVPKKRSVSSWLPRSAANSRRLSSGGGLQPRQLVVSLVLVRRRGVAALVVAAERLVERLAP